MKKSHLKLFTELIPIDTETHTKPMDTKCSITDFKVFIYLPLGFKRLNWQNKLQCRGPLPSFGETYSLGLETKHSETENKFLTWL
jgi:hypothetical protein